MRIALTQVSKRYGRVEALRDVTVDIPTGHAVALVGPNGSGKSTLTRAIMGLIRVRGAVTLDGRPVGADPQQAHRQAYVPQIAPRFAAPVGELVRAIARVRRLDPARIAEVATELDLDLQAVRKQPFHTLSGGMKQKLLIALALAPGASLYLMDEPTASLDAEARERFFEAFARRRAGATLVLCSHRLEEVRSLVDDVLALRDGRVVYHGSAAAYLASREHSVVEVRVEAVNGDVAWLEAAGFRAGATGWWARAVDREEKLRLVPELSRVLGERLQNLVVRDHEHLKIEAPEAKEAGDG